jgi:hypothetical protein
MQLKTNIHNGIKFGKCLSQAIALILMDKGRVVLMQGTALIFGYFLLQIGHTPINITIISILNLLTSIAIIYRLYAIKHGDNPNLSDCVRVSFDRGPRVALAMFLLIGLGLLAVVPFFTLISSMNIIGGDTQLAKNILTCLYIISISFLLLGGCFVKIIIITEKLNPIESLKKSFKLSLRTMPKLILVWFSLMYCFPYLSLLIFSNIVVHIISTIWLLICSAFLIVVYDLLVRK